MPYVVVDVEKTSKHLKEVFKEKGFTARAVAEELHLESVQTVYAWLSATKKTLPSLDNLVMLSELLKVTLDELIVRRSIEEE